MMMLRNSLVALALIGVMLGVNLRAQDAGGGQVMGGTDQFDANGIRRYKLGPGDVVDLRVYGQPEFNGPLVIDDDGNIELPFVDDPVFAKCKTDREIQREITSQLKKYIKRPQVSVRVTDRRSRPPAVVYGAVRSPQRVMMNRQVRLLELLAWAGGVTEQAGSEIQIFHTQPVLCPSSQEDEAEGLISTEDGAQSESGASEFQLAQNQDVSIREVGVDVPQQPQQSVRVEQQDLGESREAAQLNGESADATASSGTLADEMIQPDIKKYLGSFKVYNLADLKAGKQTANPIVQAGDVVIVREAATIFITGGVHAPAQIALREEMSLRYAIAQAGGLRKDAQGGKIRIFRRVTGKLEPQVIKVDYNAIKNSKAPDVALMPYDVIDVPSSVATPGNLLAMLLGQGVGIATSVGATLPLRMLY